MMTAIRKTISPARNDTAAGPGGTPRSMALNPRAGFVVLALAAVMAAGLLLLMQGSPLQAQDNGPIEFVEHDEGVVAVFTATDPEMKDVSWAIPDAGDPDGAGSLGADDNTDGPLFDIDASSGELTFKAAPDYEAPAGGTADNSNEYEVVVQASDGAVMSWMKVTVEVTNKDEDATTSIDLSSLQPQVSTDISVVYVDGVGNPYVDANGVANEAIEDPDRNKAGTAPTTGTDTSAPNPTVNTIPDADVEWQWSRSSSMSGTFTDIEDAESTTYQPGSADEGMYLRVTGTYEDGEGEGKTVVATSMYPVIAFPSGNSQPAFPADFDTETPTVLDAPSAEADDNATAGDDVGDPIEANDANNDRLTYSLEADSGGTAGHADLFQINRMTGQVTVGLGKTLHPETDDGETASTSVVKEPSAGFTVTIKATDPSGLSAMVTLTITVGDTDEAPVFTAGETSHSHAEEQAATVVVYTFVAYDPETSGNLPATGYSLNGADAGKFSITAGSAGELTFLAMPDFEAPGDANKDNVYEVTVKASDAGSPAKSTSVDVTVTVTNVEEDGTITLSASEPRVGVELRVTSLTDIDGGVTGATYQWSKSIDNGSTYTDIDGATMAGYTPVASDDGHLLRVTASYTDNKGSDTAMLDVATAVQKVRNLAPVFTDEDTSDDAPGITINPRAVPENSPATTAVTDPKASDPTAAAPVVATDAADAATNDDAAIFYLLSGADAFTIDSGTGQISVAAGASLDHETQSSYMVTVTARDLEGLSSSVDVTINVTNVDEPPEISGPASEEHTEHDEGVVAVFTATDPEMKDVSWAIPDAGDPDGAGSLGADDNTDGPLFDIDASSGELTFKAAPDYEAPAGGTADNSNEYEVVVQASDGAVMSWMKVTVEVTNKDEDATTSIDLSSLQPQVSTDISVVYVDGVGNPYVDANGVANEAIEDPDRNKAGTAPTTGTDTSAPNPTVNTIPDADVEWQWSRSSSMSGTFTDIEDAESTTYQPGSADEGMYLRVTGTYEDGEGEGKTVVATSMYPVIAFPSGNSQPAFPADFDTETPTVLDAPSAEADDNATAGDDVGDPIEANDANNDRLTYSLEADSGGTAGHADLFQINRMTGQVTVGLGKTLHPETDDGETASTSVVKEPSAGFTVTIKATDPSGLSAMVTLTIAVGDTDEAPVFTAGETSHSHAEEQAATVVVYTFVAYDPETSGNLPATGYSLNGADAGKFSITAGSAGELTFLAMPDFEAPGDANKDNVYEVTVKASDAGSPAKSTSVDVTVTVTNVEEDGTITLSASQPRVGVELRVTSLTDIDGGVTGATYQWSKSIDNGSTYTDIDGATMAGYTPVASDDGHLLRVTASYTDNKGSDTAMLDVATAVQKVRNLAPVFTDEDTSDDAPGITINPRAVPENSPATTAVTDPKASDPTAAAPVVATDAADAATDDDAAIFYLLSGADAFTIDSGTGQISVAAGASLDHETQSSYMVTVTARDLEGLSSSVDVTINVTNVDEPPEIMLGGIAISGASSEEVAEGMTSVGMYRAAGPDSAVATWSVEGADAAHFSVTPTTGAMTELSFSSAPDFEMLADAGMDNEYMVTLKATDGTYTDTHDVAVMVTDDDDAGTVTITGDPKDGETLTAELVDQDGTTDVTWVWEASSDMTTWTEVQAATTSAMYIVAETDVDSYLRATASYTDGFDDTSETAQSGPTDKVLASGTLLSRSDEDGDDEISKGEVQKAFREYIARAASDDPIPTQEIIDVFRKYIADHTG